MCQMSSAENQFVNRFQHLGSFTICGDFNSRLGQFTDYIADDNIHRRHILDKKTNVYGKLLQEFFISSETCILNGRNDSKDEFTSVSNKGLAVVDYVIVQQEDLENFCEMEVIQAREVFDKSNCHARYHASVPDHSLLKW